MKSTVSVVRAPLTACLMIAAWAFCDDPTGPDFHPVPVVRGPLLSAGSGSATLVAAGDIARCGATRVQDEATADLIDAIPSAAVVTLGDNVFVPTTREVVAADYDCYTPSWGRAGIVTRTHASPGDRDWSTTEGKDYFDYFIGKGAQTGERGKGYYSFDVGDWHVIALNSAIAMDAASPQYQWLKDDLAESSKECTLAYWHRPLFYSSGSMTRPSIKPLWDLLYAAGADVVLNADERFYERFRPQTPTGAVDDAYGIREFIVGTGGISNQAPAATPRANSERIVSNVFGILVLTLHADGYDWEFRPIAGQTVTPPESGSATCHTSPLPTGRPGGPYQSEATVQFDGRKSFDPQGNTPLTYSWDFGDGATHSGSEPKDATPEHTYAVADDRATTQYTVSLTITDANGEKGEPATTTVTIANIAPSVNAGPDLWANPGALATVRAYFTDPGANDGLWSYSIDWGDGTTPTQGATPARDEPIVGSHAYSTPGIYSVTVTVTDKDGGVGTDDLDVTVSDLAAPAQILTGAADIAECTPSLGDERTADLLDEIPGSVFTAGDNVNQDGTAEDYRDCYEPSWGRHKARTFAAIGNREYRTPGAGPTFDYFGSRIGPRGKAYYSFDLGAWHVVVLNSVDDEVSYAVGSPQHDWLKADLAGSDKRCTIAIFHHPRFWSTTTAGSKGISNKVKIIWDELYAAGVEMVLNGNNQHYERFRPLTPAGEADDQRGIREFIVGTGGAGGPGPVEIWETSEAHSKSLGVLKLTLEPDKYSWEFLVAAGEAAFTDKGSGTCHDPQGAGPQAVTVGVTSSANPTVYGSDVTFTATVTSASSPVSEGSVSFFDGGSCELPGASIGSAQTPDAAGKASVTSSSLSAAASPHTVIACYDGTENYSDGLGSLTHNVDRAPQSITFGELQGKKYGDPDFDVSASASSGLAVQFAASGDCTVSGKTVSVVHAGNCTISASQPGDGNYLAAPDVPRSFGIAKGAIAVAADNQSRMYGDANPALTGTLTGVKAGDNITASYATAAVPTSAVGGYPIDPTLSDPDTKLPNYDVQSTSGVLTISRAPLSAKADNKARPYGEDNPPLTGSLQGVRNNDDITVEFLTEAGRSSAVGDYAIKPTLKDPTNKLSNYDVSTTDGVLSVGKAGQSIAFGPLSAKTYGDADFTVSATATSNLAVAFAASGGCSVAGTIVKILSATNCSITASQPGDANYGPADDVTQTFAVAKKSATVTLGSLFHNYDGQPKSASASTDAPGESAFHFEYQRNGTAVAQPTDAGTYSVVATLINTNYQGSASGTLVINAGPVAIADAYSVDEDGALSIAAPGVMGNDVDSDGGTMAPSLVSSTSNGTLQFNSDGSFAYAPRRDFNGSDAFSYRVSDGNASSDPVTVTITVNAVNDAPVAIARSVSTSEDRPLSITLSASDIEKDPLTFEIIAGPTNGSLAPTATAGTYTYTPNANFNGTDEFTFTASDGTPSAPAVVTISVGGVNDAPIASDDQYAVDEDNVLTTAGVQTVFANDTDADGDPLTASHVAGQGPSSGTLTFNTNGTFRYTPNPNFHGVDSFRYQATDGKGGWTSATVTITVNPINDAPTATDDRSYTVSEDQTLTTTAVTGVLANDTDVDDAQLTAIVVTPPTSGSLTLNADGSFTYKPNADFNEADSFVYRASDGRLTSNDATVTIAVEAANDAPVAADDAFDVVEDTPRVLSVLANDSDIEASPLTPALVDGQGPANGAVSVNPGGTFTYTPNANFNGSDGFLYTVSDGSATSNAARVTITVTPVNDAPVAQPQAVTTDEHAPVAITLAGQDVENSQLAYRITAQPSHGSLSGEGNVYTYTPEVNYFGDDAFSFVVNDGTDDSDPAKVSITVNRVNDLLQSITFGELQDKKYGDPDFDVSASASSGLAVQFAASGDCTVSGKTVSIVRAGSCTVTASQPGNDSYAAADNVVRSFTINKALLTVKADDATRTYGAANPALTGSVTGVTNGDVITATYSTTAEQGGPVGSYAITPALSDPANKLGNYDVTSLNGSLTVTKAVLTAQADNKSRPYGEANPPLTGILTGVVNGDRITAEYATDATAESPAGEYSIRPSLVDPDIKLTNYDITLINGKLTIGKSGQTITFAELPAKTWGDPAFAVSATASSGLAVALAAVGNCSLLAGGTLSVTGAGSCTVTASQPGNESFTAAAEVVRTFVIAKAALTVRADNKSRGFGEQNPPLTGTLEGVRNGDPIVDSYSTDATAESPAGEYDIIASVSAPSGVLDNYDVTRLHAKLTVGKASQTITFAQPSDKTYGDPSFSVSATATSSLAVAFAASGNCSIAGTTVTILAAGGCTVTASQPGNESYGAAADVARSFQIRRATLTVTAENKSRAYGEANPPFTGTVTGFVNGDDVTASYLTTATLTSPVGEYDIEPSLAPSNGELDNYDVELITGKLTIGKATLTVRADDKFRPYGEDNPPLTGTVDGTRNGDQIVGSYTTNATRESLAGEYDIVASVTGAAGVLGNYDVTSINAKLRIGKAGQSITFAQLTNKTYGDADVPLDASASSRLPVSFSVSGDCALSGASVRITGAGSCEVTASQAGSVNYDAAENVVRSFAIGRAALTVRADDKSKLYGAPLPAFTASFAGFVLAEDPSVLAGTLSFTTSATATSDVGSYAITPSGLTSSNYTIAFVDGTLTVNRAPLTVRADDKSRLYGAANPTLTGTLIGLRNGDNIAASYATEASPGSDVGSYAITPATLIDPDNQLSNYNVSPVNGVLTVNAASLTVRADDKSNLYGAPLPAFTASFAGFVLSQDPSVLAGTLTFTTSATATSDVGSYAITPSGLTSSNYAITFVNGTLSIGRASQIITFDALTDRVYGDAAFDLVAASSSGLPVSYTASGACSVSGITVQVVTAGTCEVTASQSGNSNYEPAIAVVRSFNVAPAAANDPSYAVAEDQSLTTAAAGSVLANDAGGEGVQLVADLVQGPLAAATSSFTLNPDGTFSFTPAANFYGSVTFTYRAKAGSGLSSNVATATITVTAVNDAPGFTKGADQSVLEDAGLQTVTGWATNITSGPPNEAAQGLTFEVTGNTQPGLFSVAPAVSPSGTLTYTVAPNASGTATITIRLRDNGGIANGGIDATAPQTFTITVQPVNNAPVSVGDSYTADEDRQLTVAAAAGVLANDTDGDVGDMLRAVLVSGPSNGVLVLNQDGSFTYTPNLHFNGSDGFSYRASDGTASSGVATVAITVRPRATATLDIMPGSSTNSIGYSTSQTEIVFAILSSATFDGTLIEPASVTLGNEQGTDTPLARNTNGTLKFYHMDVNGDGRRDFYAFVNKAEMKQNGDLTLATTSLTALWGMKAPTVQLYRSKDMVRVVP